MTENKTSIPIEELSGIKLDPTEERILKDQISVTERKISYITLYRFATKLDWIIMFIGLVFSMAAGSTLPTIALLLGSMIDSYTDIKIHTISTNEFTEKVDFVALELVYIAIGLFVASYISMATWVYTGERIARQIREQYLRAILRQNIAYFDKHGSGDVTTRITSDIHLIQDGISEKVTLAFQDIAQFLSSFIIASVASWKMTLLMSYLIPLIVVINGLSSKFSAKFVKKSLNLNSRAGIIAEEAISTIRTAVAFGAQKRLSNVYNSYLSDARKEGYKKWLLHGFTVAFIFFCVYGSYSLAYWVGSMMILNHELSPGDVVRVFFSMLIGSHSLTLLSSNLQAITIAVGAGSKIFETIDRVPSIDIASDTGDKPENVDGRIQFKNINFIYPTRPEVKVLDDISFDVEPGSTVALVGSSGSGKSTIVSLVLRFYDTISGDIFLDGHDIKSLNLIWLRRQIGLVSQEPILFSTTIAENVSYGLVGSIYEKLPDKEKREMIENACKMANAHDFIMKFPDKYETMVGERGILLSGGQKQRIAIARAIIKDPKILLLDEATSALDTQSESIVQNALDNASKGRTTIVIAHRLSTIRNATKIIVMNKGVIVEYGTHKELMDKNGYYSKLVETQQIQQTLKAEENLNTLDSFIIPPKDEVNTIKDNENHQITRILSNESQLSKQKPDIEMGYNDHHYNAWELIKKVTFLNRPELLMRTLGIIASIILGCIFPIYAIIFGGFVQTFSETGDTLRHDASFWAFMFLLTGAVSFVMNFTQNVGHGFSSEKLAERIQSMYFAFILRQDISFFDEENHSVGTLASNLSLDVTHINGFVGSVLGNLLQAMTMVLASVIVSFIIGWKFTLVCLCAVPLLIIGGSIRVKMVDGFQKKTKKAYEYSAQIACEGFKNAFLASTTIAFASCISFLVNALAFWYGSKLFMNNEYELKQFFTIYMAVINGSTNAGRIFSYAPDISKAKFASATIFSLLERVPTIDIWSKNGEKVETVKGHIKFSDVHFHYPTRHNIPVLQGLNLEIKPGQYAALVGPSGCGKSTTISLTERFYDVTSGTITIDEINITKMNVNNLREQIALVSQEPSLYDMTIKENILFGSLPGQKITQDDIEKACREANIHDFIVGLPDGYDTQVGQKGTQLSGGQKQRIAIARALIRSPKILLLDEATSALDSESEKIVQNALDAAAQGRTTLAIAHRLSTIQHADVIFVIKDGKVHEQGTHQELLKLQGVYYKMVQEQGLGKSN
ncbi:7729_t:CDS:2 [Gigaspora margarita]|uniref:7729_t:CDS:1 n=1 Tax=Gigaspora margarita TaxID=4874 RepID=A0ABN7UMH5_GIGMA|nr:7729_t:CDS:2 [Gigaspora margarita]